MSSYPLLQNVLAFVAGLAVSFVLVSLIEALGHRMFPLPDIDFNDFEQLKRAIKDMPLGAFLMVELAYVAGSFVGGYTTAWLSASHPVGIAVGLGVLLTLFGVQNLIAIPHPRWFAVLSTITYVLMTLLGAKAHLATTV